MGERSGHAARGVTVLDGAAMVAGSSVALVHVRGLLRHEPAGPVWVIVGAAFAWLSLTSAGPFLLLTRKFNRGLPDYPKVGDKLWAVLGLPWLGAALLQATPGTVGRFGNPTLATGLALGLAVSSLIAMSVVWTTWVAVTPERASATFSPPWSNRVGLFLAVTWPVQCGLGMVVIG